MARYRPAWKLPDGSEFFVKVDLHELHVLVLVEPSLKKLLRGFDEPTGEPDVGPGV
jgi:hypothetical protein